MEELDKQLLIRLKNRDKDAFRYLYESYFAKMVLFAESYLYDEEDARDLVQDLFCYLWDNAHTLSVAVSLKAFRINKAIFNGRVSPAGARWKASG